MKARSLADAQHLLNRHRAFRFNGIRGKRSMKHAGLYSISVAQRGEKYPFAVWIPEYRKWVSLYTSGLEGLTLPSHEAVELVNSVFIIRKLIDGGHTTLVALRLTGEL